jgi:alpha-galactosidase/6-phospho-beta-glucosidase family protein
MLTIVLVFAGVVRLNAQTAGEYFIGGANLYINGQNDQAKIYVEEGLRKYPDDKKLQALKNKIDEEQKQENQNKNENQEQEENKENKDNNQQEQQQQGISKEDANRLLEALANDEKKVQEKVREAKAANARVRTRINW